MNKLINNSFDLQMFAESFGMDFFQQAFEEESVAENNSDDENTELGYNDSVEGISEASSAILSDGSSDTEQISDTNEETPISPSEALTQDDIIEAIKQAQTPIVDERTQQAIELMEFLEQNPQIIDAMRTVDTSAHQTLNNYVPDEITQKLQELESFKIEQEYQSLIRDMKSKYSDFDEEKVLEIVEKHDISDLDVAYKLYKSENHSTFDVNAERIKLRAELKAELMQELKNDMSSTSSIIGSGDVPPAKQEVVLSQQERRVAENLGISMNEYAEWRDKR